MCDQQILRLACAYTQSDQSPCLSLDYPLGVKPLTEHHLEFLSLKGGYIGLSESTFVKLPHCWKSCVTTQICVIMRCVIKGLHCILFYFRERREEELEYFMTKKYNRLGAKIQSRVNTLNALITDPKLVLK